MTPDEAARRLIALARRVGRLKPLNHDPERFFVDRGEVEADLMRLGEELAPRRLAPRAPPDSQFHPGRIVVGGRSVFVTTARRAARTGDAIAAARKAFR
jgi:hypothetical protein